VDAFTPLDPVGRFAAGLGAHREPALAVAVSGGPDSLALMLLAHAVPGLTVTALTVDHGLRPEAAEEARFVAALAAARGIAHHILPVRVEDCGQGVQAAARAARYAALGGWCASAGVGLLATAHHADDQAETLLMRLARGAGVGGLAGIRRKRSGWSHPPPQPASIRSTTRPTAARIMTARRPARCGPNRRGWTRPASPPAPPILPRPMRRSIGRRGACWRSACGAKDRSSF